MNNATNSTSVLDKFAEKIDFTKLEGKPEAFYKAGLVFVENGQFDDGIIEFVKIIKTVSHQESLFVDTVKELKSMGFSSADIRAAAGIPEIEGEKELGVDSQNQRKTELSLTKMKNNLLPTFIYGTGVGIGVFAVIRDWLLGEVAGYFPVTLLLIILIVFVVAEVSSRKSSDVSDFSSQRRDKISLFILLAVSGVGLYGVWFIIDLFFVHPPYDAGDGRFWLLLLLGPIALIYCVIALGVLGRLFARRTNLTIFIPPPPRANKRLYMFFLAAIISNIEAMTVHDLEGPTPWERMKGYDFLFLEQPTLWDLINPGIVGLLIYEILYRIGKRLNFRTLIIYVILALPVSFWFRELIYFLKDDIYRPYNLYTYIETVMITIIAYWLIKTHEA